MRDLGLSPRQHLAQVYGNAICSPEVVEAFFTASAGPITAIMICEPETYATVQARVEARVGRITFFDVGLAPARVMGPAGLDAGRAAAFFTSVIGEARAAGSAGPLRIFGTLSDLLCSQEKYAAALEVEALGDRLLSAEPDASILCGFTAGNFGGEDGAAQFGRICSSHDHIVRAESFGGLRIGGKADSAQRTSSQLFADHTVYIIDDDPSVRGALLRFLGMKGMTARGFETAERFLAELPGLAAGALIVDVQLPGMNGLELLAQLARTGIDWPAVVISGSHEGHDEAVARALGPDRYLRKPFDPDGLLRVLSAAGIR